MVDATFLTKDELSELVGSNQPAKQRQWLTKHGYSFDVRLNGSNVVLRDHIQKKLGGFNFSYKARPAEPDFNALEAMMSHA